MVGGETSRSRYEAARHSPVTFLKVRGKPRPCHLRTACPFCWARQAAEWWDAVDQAFFLDAVPAAYTPAGPRPGRAIELDEDRPKTPPRKIRAVGYSLVTRSHTIYLPPHIPLADGRIVSVVRDFYLARIGDQTQAIRSLGRGFARSAKVLAGMKAIASTGARSGCFENITADSSRAKGTWRLAVRQVWLVPAGRRLSVLTPFQGMTCRERVADNPWRTQVMKAMAQACRYPKAMLLTSKEGGPAYQLVTARRGLRLAANYGAFRKPHGSGK